MIKISQLVEDALTTDEIALEALRAGILNFSAYAEKIRPLIEKKLYKEVKKGSIVTALSRMAGKSKKLRPLRVNVHLEDLSIKSPLCEISYEISKEVSLKVSNLLAKHAGRGFFTSTQGIGEVSVIVPQSFKKEVIASIKTKPKGQYENLAAITVRFIEEEYIEVPNMIYTLISVLASKRINIIEIVSTFTEISFIVRQNDMKDTIEVLKDNFLF